MPNVNRLIANSRLSPALAVSASAHLAIVLALSATLRTDFSTMHNPDPALSVVLVSRQVPEELASKPMPSSPVQLASALPHLPEPIAATPNSSAPTPLRIAADHVESTPLAPMGSADAHVAFAPASVIARLGDYLATRSMSEFPPEIDATVQSPGQIEVEYPPAALQERREARVLAWVVVSAEGEVEEISIAEGGPEFGEPVQNALLVAKFLPARNEGVPIRYYTMLEFSFRLGAAPASIRPAPK